MHNALLEHIKSVNPQLYEIIGKYVTLIRDLDKQDYCGVTFIMPTDDVAAKLEAAADGDAVDAIRAHIVYDVLRTPQEWRAANGDIMTANNKSLDVTSAAHDSVTISGGAVIKLDKVVADDAIVWKVVSGAVAESAKQPAGERARRQTIEPVKGGAENSYTARLREQIAIIVGNKFAVERTNNVLYTSDTVKIGGHQGGRTMVGKVRDALMEHTISLVYFIGKHDPSLLYNRVLPVFSYQRFDFYNLVEPFRTRDEYLIPHDVIEKWWAAVRGGMKLHLISIIDCIDKWYTEAKSHCNCVMYSDPTLVAIAIERCRVKIAQMRTREDQRVALMAAYDALVYNNCIGNVSNVLPADLCKYYKGQHNLKRAQDEARYISTILFDRLDRQFIIQDYSTILSIIAELLVGGYNPNEAYSVLFNKNAPDTRSEELYAFVCSTAMLYVPFPPKLPYPTKTVNHRPLYFGDPKVYNIQSAAVNGVNKALFDGSANANELNTAINTVLNQAGLDQDVAAKLRSLIK